MNEEIRERLNRLKGKYAQQYGTLMDDWTSMVLEEFRELFEQLTGQVKDTTEIIKEAQFKIRKSQRVFQITSGKQAWLLGLGITVPLAICIALVTALGFWYAYTGKRFEEMRDFIDAHENIAAYTILAQNGEVIEKDQVQYLVLKVAQQAEAVPGIHYFFDADKKEVRVPLNQKSSAKTDR